MKSPSESLPPLPEFGRLNHAGFPIHESCRRVYLGSLRDRSSGNTEDHHSGRGLSCVSPCPARRAIRVENLDPNPSAALRQWRSGYYHTPCPSLREQKATNLKTVP